MDFLPRGENIYNRNEIMPAFLKTSEPRDAIIQIFNKQSNLYAYIRETFKMHSCRRSENAYNRSLGSRRS